MAGRRAKSVDDALQPVERELAGITGEWTADWPAPAATAPPTSMATAQPRPRNRVFMLR